MTAARVPLPHWRTQSRPCRHLGPAPAVFSPAYLAAFARFAIKRLIVVGKFERNVKYHLSMSSKLGFRVPRSKRNDTSLRAFVKRFLFFASHMASAVGHVARDSTSWARRRSASVRGQSVWAAAEGRGKGRPDLSTTNTDASVVRSLTLSRLMKAKKRQSIYKCKQKCVISTVPKNTKPEFLEHG